jgi:hypothetical protein
MGFEFTDRGLEVVLSRSVPQLVRDRFAASVDAVCEHAGISVSDLDHFVLHPGGAKVLDAYADVLPIEASQLCWSREVLRTHGNMSAPTALFVLRRALDDAVRPGGAVRFGVTSRWCRRWDPASLQNTWCCSGDVGPGRRVPPRRWLRCSRCNGSANSPGRSATSDGCANAGPSSTGVRTTRRWWHSMSPGWRAPWSRLVGPGRFPGRCAWWRWADSCWRSPCATGRSRHWVIDGAHGCSSRPARRRRPPGRTATSIIRTTPPSSWSSPPRRWHSGPGEPHSGRRSRTPRSCAGASVWNEKRSITRPEPVCVRIRVDRPTRIRTQTRVVRRWSPGRSPGQSPATGDTGSSALRTARGGSARWLLASPASIASRRWIEMSATRTWSSSKPAPFTPSSSMM